MAKVILFVLMCATLIGLGSCASIFWNGTFSSGSWTDGRNWQNGTAPGPNDCAYIDTMGVTITIPTASVGNVTFLRRAFVTVAGGQFSVGGVLAFRAQVDLTVSTGASINIGAHFEIGAPSITFALYGTVTAAALKVTSGSYATGIPNSGPSSVLLTGASVSHVIDADIGISANSFVFSSSVTHSFYATSPTGPAGTLTFLYTPTILSFNILNNYFNPIPVGFTFQQGANILSSNGIQVSNTTGVRPAFSLFGTFTLSAATVTMGGTPTFNGATIVINGGVLAFSDVDATFGVGASQSIIGTGGMTFASTDSNGRTATFNNVVNIFIPTFTFARTGSNIPPNWNLAGNTLIINYPYTISTIFTLTGLNLTFPFPVTINNGGHLRGGPGAVVFTDGIINNGGFQAYTFNPIFRCTTGSFNISGTGSFSLLGGLTIQGCTINTASNAQVTVSTSIAVTANTTIDILQINLNYSFVSTFTFSSPSGGVNSLYNSLTIRNQVQGFPVNFTFIANRIDVVLNSTLALIFGTNLNQAGPGGQFTLNGGLSLSDNNVISASVALPSGPYSITQTNTQALATTWNGNLLLRNTILSGNGQINYSGNLFILNGLNYINTNSFNINGATSVRYVQNQTTMINFLENPTLIFNAGATRTLNNPVNALGQVTVVFNDATTLVAPTATGTLTLDSSATGASIVFNNSQITLNGQATDSYTVSGNTVFNTSSTRITNNGVFNINGNVTTFGAINNPGLSGDATVILSATFIVARANTIFGPTVLLGSAFSTDDSDRNSSTVLTSITFNSTAGILYPITGTSFTFLSNVTFLGPVFFKNVGGSVTISGQNAFVTFNGNCILVSSNLALNIRTIFANPLNISANSQNNAFTITVQRGVTPNQVNDGLWIGGNLFLGFGITLNAQSNLNIYFLSAVTVSGTGTFQANSPSFFGNGAVNIQPLFVTIGNTGNPTTFFGTAGTTYTIAPTNINGNANFGTVFVANVPVSYTGASITLTSATTFPTAFTFNSPTVTFSGNVVLTFSGTRTLAATNAFAFNNVPTVVFLSTVTLNNALPFTSIGGTPTTINFQFDVILGTPVTISLPVTFGVSAVSSLTVSGNTLTLTGLTVTVNGNVIILSSIVSNRVTPGIQTVAGNGAFFGNLWSFNIGVCFSGTFNFTTPINFNQPHVLRSPVTLNLPQGLSFSGAGALSGTGSVCVFNYLNNTGSSLTLPPGVTLTTAGTPFLVTGPLVINGTYNCRGQVTFANSITFGYSTNLGASNAINFLDNCQWLGTNAITIVRSSINANRLTTIFTPIVLACANTSQTVFSGASANLFINNDITISAPDVNLNGAQLGPINIITTFNGAFVRNVNPTNVITFNSNPTSAEPIVSFLSTLNQPANLLAPTRFDNLVLGSNSAVYSTNGQGRADLGDSLTTQVTVIISVPTNLFVTTNTTGSTFTLTLQGTRTSLSLTPTLTSPFGFPAPNFAVSASDVSSVLRLTANPTLTFNNLNINGAGTARFSQGTVNVLGTVQVNAGATLWQDLSTFTAFNATFVAATTSGGLPGVYRTTVNSATPNTLSTQYAVYGGSGVVFLSGFAPTQNTTVTVINAALAAFGNVLSPVVGTPGYSYSAGRNGNSLTFTISPNAGPIPIPTQSNGPAPPVSSAPSQFFSFLVLFISFAIVFISLC